MFSYYLKLAGGSLRRNPGITTLMVLAIALGIAVCVMTLTVYHSMSSNPIWWKNDQLYALTLDSWDPNEAADTKRPELPPPQLTWRDAEAMTSSGIPVRSLRMMKSGGILADEERGGTSKPEAALARVTSRDFFEMFDVPFLYGGAWSERADADAEPVIVLSRKMNEHFFGGKDSVGRSVRWNDQSFRVVGVLDDWHPSPTFYDLNNGSFEDPESIYVPVGWVPKLELDSAGNTNCWKPEQITSFTDFMNSECVWMQVWVELPDVASRAKMQEYMDAYTNEQRKAGRFARPNNNRLSNVEQWLEVNEVVQDDNRMLVALAFAFLAVCLINTVGLLLAKFLGQASISGVRRALGASRRQIFLQHLTEAGALAFVGALLGVLFAALGLLGLRGMYQMGDEGFRNVIRLDPWSLGIALALAIGAALAAGLYPAWRVGRLAPSVYLKSQ